MTAATYTHGLVIGKFYPPHAGHHHLIREASRHADRVTVIVMAADYETIPLHDRVAWLEDEHATDLNVTIVGIPCELPVDYNSDPIWDAQTALMHAAVATVTPQPVDAVFTSEPYGDRLAAAFNATHHPVDPSRGTYPTSGTAIRDNLHDHWDDLAPATKAGLTTRIIVVGAESTGTTTLSTDLTKHYATRNGIWAKTTWIPEYGREYTVLKLQATGSHDMNTLIWTPDDFAAIAKEQNQQETIAARRGSPLLICDTDALATRLWERRYIGNHSHAAQDAVPTLPPRDLYLLTDHTNVPFEQDGYRDGEHIREEMTGWFIDTLTREQQPWALLTGPHPERMDLATRMIDRLLTEKATFRAPLG